MLKNIQIKNKRAKYEYEFLDSFTAGIMLKGTEIKAIRLGKASIIEAYCVAVDDEIFIRNMSVQEYANAGYASHQVRGDRKLLLNRKEIDKIVKKLKNKGFTLIPYVLFINDKGKAKIDIKLCRGKNTHDKRQDLKNQDAKREMDRVKKEY